MLSFPSSDVYLGRPRLQLLRPMYLGRPRLQLLRPRLSIFVAVFDIYVLLSSFGFISAAMF